MDSQKPKMAEKKYVENELSKLLEFTIHLEDELNNCVNCEQ